MIRADIDALSIQEKTEFEFKSVNDGFMHACGHDTHNAMLLGAVKVLKDMQAEFAGTVRFCFQPGEESCEGALLMIKEGIMDGVGYAFGIHIDSMTPSGMITGRPGQAQAGVDWFKIHI